MRNIKRYYRACALIFFNALVLFIAINGILFAAFRIKDSYFAGQNPAFSKCPDAYRRVYPGLTDKEINALLDETRSLPRIHEPYTQFKEKPCSGKYVNVAKEGFRLVKNQGPWPPEKCNFNIFVFGGSTIFNYGVADDETVASYLQEFLSEKSGLKKPIFVYNFGRGNYYSTQELILYERLLTSGFIPDMAIFIDGLNDFCFLYRDIPRYTERMSEFVDNMSDKKMTRMDFLFVNKLPITRAIEYARYKYKASFGGGGEDEDAEEYQGYDNKEVMTQIIDKYLRNKKMIEAVSGPYGVKPVFVWQPVPTYKYNMDYHLFTHKAGLKKIIYSEYGYPYMEKLAKGGNLGNNFLWCADMQEGSREPLYVDLVHYSKDMSKRFAREICNLLLERGLIQEKENE